VVIVDGIGGAPLGRIVRAGREPKRRVLVPACHRQCHRTCSERSSGEGVGLCHGTERGSLSLSLSVPEPTTNESAETTSARGSRDMAATHRSPSTVAPLEEKTGGVAKTPQAVSRQRRTWIGETDSEKCWVQFREWHPDLRCLCWTGPVPPPTERNSPHCSTRCKAGPQLTTDCSAFTTGPRSDTQSPIEQQGAKIWRNMNGAGRPHVAWQSTRQQRLPRLMSGKFGTVPCSPSPNWRSSNQPSPGGA
jgi:hypothetical protein